MEPITISLLLIAAFSGAAASKGTSKVREFLNDGEKIDCKCPRCADGGPHVFACIDRSVVGGAFIGVVLGAAGGAVAGVLARRIFRCRSCSVAMYDEGQRPTWNADEAIAAFVQYPKLKAVTEDLQGLVARNQAVAARHAAAIADLEHRLQRAEGDKVALERDLRRLVDRMRLEAA